MQILVFLACFFFQKLAKKNLWRVGLNPPPPPLGKGRVEDVLVQHVSPSLPTKDSAFCYQCLHLRSFGGHGDR